jgi:iron complex transport system ATP-binding protein
MSLVADDISLHLAGFDLLRDIDLTVVPGQVTAVVGPNGAGKTSLLRVLAGDLAASHGRVLLNGNPLSSWDMEARARMLAVLPQHAPLEFPFTAREVVSLGRTPHRTGRVRDSEIVTEALELADARYLDKRFYTQMSGGEKQRVQLARVLAQIWEPVDTGERILVLDEPTASFDLSHQQLTLAIVRRFADNGVGVLLVVHDLNLAARCADTLVVLSCGRIAAQGRPDDVLHEALIEQVFGVSCVVQRHPADGTPLVIT